MVSVSIVLLGALLLAANMLVGILAPIVILYATNGTPIEHHRAMSEIGAKYSQVWGGIVAIFGVSMIWPVWIGEYYSIIQEN